MHIFFRFFYFFVDCVIFDAHIGEIKKKSFVCIEFDAIFRVEMRNYF